MLQSPPAVIRFQIRPAGISATSCHRCVLRGKELPPTVPGYAIGVLSNRFGDPVEITGDADAAIVTRIELVPVMPRLREDQPPQRQPKEPAGEASYSPSPG